MSGGEREGGRKKLGLEIGRKSIGEGENESKRKENDTWERREKKY